MPEPRDKHPKALVSVEFQTEIDLATARPERRMFVKMYFDARDSGLLADIGARRWHTLCALATYMDEKGLCYPSQARLAKDLGLHRASVNERVQELLAYRFNGRPVITVKKARLSTANGGRWANNVYEILPVTGFRIFDDAKAEKQRESGPSAYVAKTRHRPMSGEPDTGNHDTNESHTFKKTFNVNAPTKTSEEDDEEARRRDLRRQALVLDIIDTCGDQHSRGSYIQITRTYPEQLIREALSLTKDGAARGRIRKSKGAYFTDMVHRLARERGLPGPQEQARTA